MQWLKEHDVALVREMLLFQPWQHKHGSPEGGMEWRRISEGLTGLQEPRFKPLGTRSMREQYKFLQLHFKK